MNKKKVWDVISYVLLSVIALLLLGVFILRFIFFEVEIVGTSMAETLKDGETIIARRQGKAERGRIIIIDVPDRLSDVFTGEFLVKRIVAVEGDSLYCLGGVLYLKQEGETDFSALSEDYISSRTPDFSEVTLKEGEIYCLGDNRAPSKDSTEVGAFSVSDIFGYLDEDAIRLSRTSVWGTILKFLI